MERLFSPAAVAASTTTTSTQIPAAKQPTYTTAGTIYNPKASQPLQPPVRRGRAFRWANGGATTDLALLPKSALAMLPLRGNSRQTSLLQQYSPLQQNHDRAISPIHLKDQDHLAVSMSLKGTLTESGSVRSQPSPLFPGSSEDKSPDEDGTDDSDGDSDFGMDPLTSMTVKSLQNLASYPNPNQKRARRALLGTKPNGHGLGMRGRSCSPSKSSCVRPIGSPPKTQSSAAHVSRLDTSAFPSFDQWADSRLDSRSTSTHDTPCWIPPYSDPSAAHKAFVLSNGPGAPRPLTAGPPGQRQYRASTFESVLRALQAENQQMENSSCCEKVPEVQGSPQLHADMEEWPGVASSSARLPQPRSISPYTVHASPGVGTFTSHANNSELWRVVESARTSCPGGLSAATSSSRSNSLNSGHAKATENDLEDMPNFGSFPGSLADFEVNIQNEKIDRFWYAGAGILNRSTADTASDAKIRKIEHSLGVIGDRRPSMTQSQYRPITIEEANRTPASDHSKPLLNMAFASLVAYKEQEQARADGK